MIRLNLSIGLQYEVQTPNTDFIFNFQPAHTRYQTVLSERLHVNPSLPLLMHTDRSTLGRILRLTAQPGWLQIAYQATVDLQHHVAAPIDVSETRVADLPPMVLTYLYPSRYCQSDRLRALAMAEFGHLRHGYSRVQAVQDWVRQRVIFKSNSSNSTTSALDTLADGMGVCRDFSHLMIALCRALNIPARFTTGIDYGADPALGPTDFHAYVEVFLAHRWYLFDPSGAAIPMGFVRMGTGRDAADVSFATIFGSVHPFPPTLAIQAVVDPVANCTLPVHCAQALSTDDGNWPMGV